MFQFLIFVFKYFNLINFFLIFRIYYSIGKFLLHLFKHILFIIFQFHMSTVFTYRAFIIIGIATKFIIIKPTITKIINIKFFAIWVIWFIISVEYFSFQTLTIVTKFTILTINTIFTIK